MRQMLIILGYLWVNRKNLMTLKKEVMDVYVTIRVALEDDRIDREELLKILNESGEVLDAIKPLLGIKEG